MLKLNAKSDAGSLLCLLSHFECDGHTVHMLTQQHLPPPLTSTVKSSLFMHVHPSPGSLAARSHRCLANRSRYVNNGWTFSRQNSYVQIKGIHFSSCLKCKVSFVPFSSLLVISESALYFFPTHLETSTPPSRPKPLPRGAGH